MPTFTWLEDQFSPDGIPLLSINFHDGKPNDVAVLKQFNPIPRQQMEREEDIDKCIFNGHLRDESTVYVTLTGGCPFDKDFDVRMILIVVKSTFSFAEFCVKNASNSTESCTCPGILYIKTTTKSFHCILVH